MRQQKIKELIDDFPQTFGVYLMKNDKNQVIYVGKAKQLKSRVASYFNKNPSVKVAHLVSRIKHIDYIVTLSEEEAFLLEASLIKKFKPRYNIRLKDDKSYPYICCDTKHEFPRFYFTRKVKFNGSRYFGPYTYSYKVRKLIQFLNYTFKIRDCTDQEIKNRKRPCLLYEMEQCTAPCVKKISKKNYSLSINKAIELLECKNKKVIYYLKDKMKEYSAQQRFEQAAKVRDQIEIIKEIWQKQSVVSSNKNKDQDVFHFFGEHRGTLIQALHIRKGFLIGEQSHFLSEFDSSKEKEDEKEWFVSFLNQFYVDNIIPDEMVFPMHLGPDIYKVLKAVFYSRQKKKVRFLSAMSGGQLQLLSLALKNAKENFKKNILQKKDLDKGLEDIQKKFSLSQKPFRIECLDVSHLQGDFTVAGLVCFQGGVPFKQHYRRYKVKSQARGDDYLALYEVVSRRLRDRELNAPDLLIVDGGKAQLKVALKAMKEENHFWPVVGLAKARTQSGFEDRHVASTGERFFLPNRKNPIVFRKNSKAFQILVQLRDEAHRYALSYHRYLRNHSQMNSKSFD